jgi:plasmid maintenance system antidote protein VapI
LVFGINPEIWLNISDHPSIQGRQLDDLGAFIQTAVPLPGSSVLAQYDRNNNNIWINLQDKLKLQQGVGA